MKQTKTKAAVSPQSALFRSSTFWSAFIVGLAFAVLLFATVQISTPTSPDVSQSVVIVDAEMRVDAGDVLSKIFGDRFHQDLFSLEPVAPISPPGTKITEHHFGTAFMVDGRLLTAAHIVVMKEGGELVRVTVTTKSGVGQEVKLLRFDRDADLAELSPVNIPSLHLAWGSLHIGDQLTTIGHPALIRFVVSQGLLVGFDREQGCNITTMDTFRGNSGGPVVNTGGRVVGLVHSFIAGTRFTGIGTLQATRNFLYPDETR
jgi:S1-C subfamily serine protease